MPQICTRVSRRSIAICGAVASISTISASSSAADAPAEDAKVAGPILPPEMPTPRESVRETARDATPKHPITSTMDLPVAGFSGGNFYIRGDDDRWVLFPGGRLQMDGYGFTGPGVSNFQRSDGSGLVPNVKASRARAELAGRLDGKYYFWLGIEAGGMKLDGSLNTTSTANVGDAFVGAEIDRLFDIRFGQFDIPFMMANVTSDKYFDLMERPLTVRDVGAPYNKDIGLMIRGETADEIFNYAIAVVGGGGQNRPTVDGMPDVDLRVFFRPFATSRQGPIARAHFGVSGQVGQRDPTRAWYDVPTLTTPGGFAFWTPTWGKSSALENVMPSDRQLAVAGELYLPFLERLDLTAEAVYINRSTREAIYAAGVVDQRYDTTTGPYGALKGLSYYLQLAIWAAGTPRINGEPGTYPLPKLRTSTAGSSGDALEVVVRWEQLLLDYNSNSRNAATAAKGFLDGGIDGNSGTTSLKLDDLQVGVTYWATKHVRFTAQVSYYIVPGTLNGSYDRFGVSHSPTGNPTNQAQSPGALGGTTSVVNSGGNTTTTVTGFNFNANTWEEFSVRAAIAL